MGSPSIRILSRTATRCGEVYNPILAFGATAFKIDDANAEVDPLPFVPAT